MSTGQTLEIVGVRAAFWARDTKSPRTSIAIPADRITDEGHARMMARYLSTDNMDDGAVDFWTSVGGGVMVRDTVTGKILARYAGGREAGSDWPPFNDLPAEDDGEESR